MLIAKGPYALQDLNINDRKICESVLAIGVEHFAMSTGIVSHIVDNEYKIIAVLSPGNVFVAGDIFQLNDTYCREVVDKGRTIALTQLNGVPGLRKHPLYAGLPLESYIAAPIIVDNKIWGTLNFSSMKIRSQPFSLNDVETIELYAAKIQSILEAQSS